ncbi:helix-turn-helix transcriptional regulator [Rossellomorea vietnamensis]|uniref:Helix-turn-helix transcriptional regulator n=1 Tax=Rossellomorea vietnamensis TaxID=218284 RepID=A0ACD4C4H4_9BACI|nr:helix-turn-helix transcriptional regulator [Rossellomorea vietnamensis]UXH43322.1 helix-turn-helix transcriptional regulator [Rossellomorea vietnamensis]
MDYSVIGKKIKEMRKVVGITQKELAEGICTQALISRIEKGDIYPSATTLYQIAIKLGVDVNYFFEIGTTPRLDYITEVEKQLRHFRIYREYEEMMELIKTEEKNPLFYKDDEKLQLLYWHKGIYQFEVEKDPSKAFSLLDQAYHLTAHRKKAMSEREMQILSSKGSMNFTLKHYDSALHYYNQVETAIHKTVPLQDKSIKTKLYYNIARVLTRMGELEQSTRYCTKAIKWCLEEELLWGVGELHYQIGYNYELAHQYEKALSYFRRALHMFELRKDVAYISFLRPKMEEMAKDLSD